MNLLVVQRCSLTVGTPMATVNNARLANRMQAIDGGERNLTRQFMLAKQERSFLEDLEAMARTCTGAMVERGPSGMTVSASGLNGFNMSVMVEEGRYALYFDNWVEEFELEEIARELFEAALKGEVRIKVDILSGRRWRWTLERVDSAGNWHAESSTDHVIWRFWGRQSTIYLRNTFPPLLLSKDRDSDAILPN